MDKTRNLFIVQPIPGKETPEAKAELLGKLQFKGLTVLDTPNVSKIEDAFKNNKSVVCFASSKDTVISSFGNSIPVQLDPACDIVQQFQEITTSHHCDIGDHVSNSSGLKGIPSKKDCAYCAHLISPQEDNLYLGQSFFIFPTLGQFINGYLLIIPYEHVMSVAELDITQRREFLEVLADARYLLNLAYGCAYPLVWENGTGNGGKGKSKDSVVHAHVHVAPSHLNIRRIKELSGFPMSHTSIESLSAYGRHSYLLVQGNTESDWWVNDNPTLYIPRQYIRQLIAEDENVPGDNWNWRTHGFTEQRHQTNLDIYRALLKNWHQVPKRIKHCTEQFMSTFQA